MDYSNLGTSTIAKGCVCQKLKAGQKYKVAQLFVCQTGEQAVAGSSPAIGNILLWR